MTYCFQHSPKKAVLGTVVALILSAVYATSAQSASVTLAWNANSEPNIAGYRLYYGTASHTYTQQIDVGNSTTGTVSNLSSGTTYFFAITAYNTAGVESAFSSELAYTPPLPTPTPTPSPGGTPVNISGAISYCTDPTSPAVPDVTLTLTGSVSGSVQSDSAGSYQFTSLPRGGNYTVTPTKGRVAAGSPGISTVDVVATQRHFLTIAAIPAGCRLTAADVNGDTVISTMDVIAIQRFALGLTTGTANVGKYQFTPASRTYSGLVSNQVGQNYGTLIFGDVASGFVYRPEGSMQSQSSVDTGAVAAVALPEVAVDLSVTDFVAEVTTTTINADAGLVGFQGDLTFDETVVTFGDNPVQNAGLTAGNWTVSGNVLPGDGPIRTLRVSAYSNDFRPLFGSGTLFNLNMIRVSSVPGESTALTWAVAPEQFIFVDADLNSQAPGSAVSGLITLELNP